MFRKPNPKPERLSNSLSVDDAEAVSCADGSGTSGSGTSGSSAMDADPDALLADIADRYREALKQGKQLSVDQLASQYPNIADSLRAILPAITCLQSGSSSRVGRLRLRPDQTLGPYRIVQEIGRGGMGIVYEAIDTKLGARKVALKVLPYTAMLDDRQLVRFQNESRAAASLSHPNIVPVYGVGEYEGTHYYAMQLIQGKTLAEIIAGNDFNDSDNHSSKRTSAETVARLGVQAADALEHAHESGVLHRDVKPANMLVQPDGHLWLTDFGLARLDDDVTMTVTGDILGTLRYMSPEQALGQRAVVDQRADVYSLGTTLYEMVTGCPAFPGTDRFQLLQQIATVEPRRPRQIASSIPVDLETILLKAMAKEPGARYVSAAELRDDLKRFLNQEAIRAKPPSVRMRLTRWAQRHQSLVWTAIAAMVIVMISLFASTLVVTQAYRSAEDERVRATRNLHLARRVIDDAYANEYAKLREQPIVSDAEREFIVRLVNFYESLQDDELTDLQLRREAAEANLTLGDSYRLLGDPKRAVIAYERAVDLQTTQVPETLTVENGTLLAKAYAGAGLARQDAESTELAIANLKQSLDVAEQLRARYPDRPDVHLLSTVQLHLARAYRDPKLRERSLREALSLFAQLTDQFPQEAGFRSASASARSLLGDVLHSQGRIAEAEEQFSEALAQLDSLTEQFEREPKHRSRLARTRHRFALMLDDNGRYQDATSQLVQAIETVSQLRQLFPSRVHHAFELAELHLDHGKLELAALQMDSAADSFQTALGILDECSGEHPSRTVLEARTYAQLGNLALRSRQTEMSAKSYGDAIRRWQRLVDAFPDNLDFRVGLTIALGDRARLMKPDDRARIFRETTDALRKWADRYPDQIQFRTELLRFLTYLGNELRSQDNLDAAEACYLEITKNSDAFARDNPDIARYRESAGEFTNYGDLSIQLGKFEQAQVAHRYAAQNCRDLVRQFPDNRNYQLMLASVLKRFAWSLAKSEKMDEARRYYDESIQTIERLRSTTPDDPKLLAKLSRRYRMVADLQLQRLSAASQSAGFEQHPFDADHPLQLAESSLENCIRFVNQVNTEHPDYAWTGISPGKGYLIEVQDRMRLAACQLSAAPPRFDDALATLATANELCSDAGDLMVGSIVRLERAELMLDHGAPVEELADTVAQVWQHASRPRAEIARDFAAALNWTILQWRCGHLWHRLGRIERSRQVSQQLLKDPRNLDRDMLAVTVRQLAHWPDGPAENAEAADFVRSLLRRCLHLAEAKPAPERYLATIRGAVGVAHFRLGEIDDAIANLQRSAERSAGGSVTNRYYQAMAFAAAARTDDAQSRLLDADRLQLRDGPLSVIKNWRLGQRAQEMLAEVPE